MLKIKPISKQRKIKILFYIMIYDEYMQGHGEIVQEILYGAGLIPQGIS